MSKYIIWDKKSDVITPSGSIFTPEKWIENHPVAKVLDTICGGGEINGSVFGVYSQFKEMYEKQGVDFSDCSTKQECLDKIEAYEDELNTNTVVLDDQTRIADALEDLVVLSMPDAE